MGTIDYLFNVQRFHFIGGHLTPAAVTRRREPWFDLHRLFVLAQHRCRSHGQSARGRDLSGGVLRPRTVALNTGPGSTGALGQLPPPPCQTLECFPALI